MKRRETGRSDLEAVYESSYPRMFAPGDCTEATKHMPVTGTGPRFVTFEAWKAAGCPSFIDYSPDEQAVVERYLAESGTPPYGQQVVEVVEAVRELPGREPTVVSIGPDGVQASRFKA